MDFAEISLKAVVSVWKGARFFVRVFSIFKHFLETKGVAPYRAGGYGNARVSRYARGSRLNVNRSESHWKGSLADRLQKKRAFVLLRHSKVDALLFRAMHSTATTSEFLIRSPSLSNRMWKVGEMNLVPVVRCDRHVLQFLSCETASKLLHDCVFTLIKQRSYRLSLTSFFFLSFPFTLITVKIEFE